MKKKCGVFLLAFFLLGFCLNAQTDMANGKRVLRVGGFSNVPLLFLDSQGKAAGVFPDLLNKIAEKNNWQIEYRVKALDLVLDELRTGKIDLMLGVAFDESRQEFMKFTDENILTMWGQIFLPVGSDIQTIFDLKDKRIGVLKGGINRKNLEEKLTQFQINANLITFSTYDEILAAIQQNQIDAGVLSNLHADYLLYKFNVHSSSIVFAPFSLRFALAMGEDDETGRKIDAEIRTWKKQENSFYYKTLAKWHQFMRRRPDDDLQWLYRVLYLTLVTIIALAILLKLFQSRVAAKTAELRALNEKLTDEIEQKKQIHDKLELQKEQYRAITESSNDIIIRWSADHRHLYANHRAIEVSGVSFDEHLGKTLEEINLPERMRNLLGKSIDGVLATGEADKIEFSLPVAEKQLHIEMNLNPEFNSEGKIVSVVGVGRDISERLIAESANIDLEKKLQHAMRLEAIGTLAGGIAHDFNNILTPILGYSEVLSEDIDTNDENLEAINEISRAARRGKELARQILVFSRQPESQLRPIKLDEILKEVLKLIRPTLPATIEIFFEPDPECPQIAGDPAQLHQLLINLFTNAFYAMKEQGGVLMIKSSVFTCTEMTPEFRLLPGTYAYLQVADTGAGMSPEVVERIFEPYFSTKPKEQGSGLGLFMVHSIVSKMGGRIVVKSEPGRGTEFHLFFPEAQGIVDNEKVSTSSKEKNLGNGEKIVVVDDEEMIVKLSKRILSRLGYQVVTFTSSDEALRWFKENFAEVDLLFTDMTMPGLTGADLAAAALNIKPDLPIIICTGFSEAISPEIAARIGAKDLLIKPLGAEELAASVKKVLNAAMMEKA